MKTDSSTRGLDGPSPTEYRRERVSTRKETAMSETRIHRYDEAVQEWHEFRMAAERRLADGSSASAHASPAVR